MLQSCFWLFKSTSHRLVIKSILPETTGVMRIDQETVNYTLWLSSPANYHFPRKKKKTSHILTRLWWLFGDFVGVPTFTYQVEGGLCPHIDLSSISDGVSRVASQVGSHQILREDELTIAGSTASAVRGMTGNALDRKLGSCHVSQRLLKGRMNHDKQDATKMPIEKTNILVRFVISCATFAGTHSISTAMHPAASNAMTSS